MGTVVQFKRSTSAGSKPATSDLIAGELAVNTADGKLFLEKDNGTIVEVGLGNNELILDDSIMTTASLTTSTTNANQVVDSFAKATFSRLEICRQI